MYNRPYDLPLPIGALVEVNDAEHASHGVRLYIADYVYSLEDRTACYRMSHIDNETRYFDIELRTPSNWTPHADKLYAWVPGDSKGTRIPATSLRVVRAPKRVGILPDPIQHKDSRMIELLELEGEFARLFDPAAYFFEDRWHIHGREMHAYGRSMSAMRELQEYYRCAHKQYLCEGLRQLFKIQDGGRGHLIKRVYETSYSHVNPDVSPELFTEFQNIMRAAIAFEKGLK